MRDEGRALQLDAESASRRSAHRGPPNRRSRKLGWISPVMSPSRQMAGKRRTRTGAQPLLKSSSKRFDRPATVPPCRPGDRIVDRSWMPCSILVTSPSENISLPEAHLRTRTALGPAPPVLLVGRGRPLATPQAIFENRISLLRPGLGRACTHIFAKRTQFQPKIPVINRLVRSRRHGKPGPDLPAHRRRPQCSCDTAPDT